MKPSFGGWIAAGCVIFCSVASGQQSSVAQPALMASTSAYSASPDRAPSPEASGITLRKEMAEVHLELTATDAQRRPVATLDASQVTILDEGLPVTTVTDFRRESDLPLDLGILIDASDSVGLQLAMEQQAAIDLARRVLRQDSDRAFVEAFGTKVLLLHGLTGDRDRIAGAIRNLQPLGLTSLYDAIFAACHDRFSAPGVGLVRRAIVLLTDGEDSYSIHGLDEAILSAQSSAVTIYAIALHRASKFPSVGDRVLDRLTEATGGRYFVVSRPRQLQMAFADIESELRSGYSISYALPEHQRDGRYHSLRVQASGNVSIRTRSGYLAPEH